MNMWRSKTKHSESPLLPDLRGTASIGFRWWRGWDLNPRPSGYEFDERCPGLWRPLLPDLAEDLADPVRIAVIALRVMRFLFLHQNCPPAAG